MLAFCTQTYTRAFTGLATRSLPCASRQAQRTYATDAPERQNRSSSPYRGNQGSRAGDQQWTFNDPKRSSPRRPNSDGKFSSSPLRPEWKHQRSFQQRSAEGGRDNRGYDYRAARGPSRDGYQGRGASDRYQERRGEDRDQENRDTGRYQQRWSPNRDQERRTSGGYQGRRPPDGYQERGGPNRYQGRGNPHDYQERRTPDRSRQTVRVERLPPDATFSEIASLFSQYGPILSSRLFDDKAQTPNSALITYASVQNAEAAVNDRTPLRLGGKKLRCSLMGRAHRMDEQRTVKPVYGPSLLVYNVPSETTADRITEVFGKVANVSNVEITIDEDTGERAHSLIVNFSSPEDARKAFEYHRMRPFDLGEGELTLRHVPVKAPSDPSENPDFSRMRRSQFLRVNGLPKFTTRDSIYHLFQPHADVKNIVMQYFRDGQPMPTCIVEFASHADAEAVMSAHQNHNFQLSSSSIYLDYTSDPAEREAPPDNVLKVSGFQGGLAVLKRYFEPYALYVKDIKLLPTSQSLFSGSRRDLCERWATGFVTFDTVEHASLAKEQLTRAEVEYGVRLHVTYGFPPKVPAEPAGMWGNDNGDEEYAFGKKNGGAQIQRAEAVVEELQSGRGRFSYEKVDWTDRPATKRNW